MRTVVVAAVASVAALLAAAPACAEGFRAEIHGGWDHLAIPGDNDEDGVLYGIGLGYDHALSSKAFIGIDFSLDESTAEDCRTGGIVPGDQLCVDAGRDIAIGLRGGFNVGERGKLYALAGYTNARFTTEYTNAAGVTTRDGENLDGFRLGAGYEHRIAGNAYGKVEYRYSNYEADLTRHQVLVGVGLNF
jgi:outer membrane immunogenic protein